MNWMRTQLAIWRITKALVRAYEQIEVRLKIVLVVLLAIFNFLTGIGTNTYAKWIIAIGIFPWLAVAILSINIHFVREWIETKGKMSYLDKKWTLVLWEAMYWPLAIAIFISDLVHYY